MLGVILDIIFIILKIIGITLLVVLGLLLTLLLVVLFVPVRYSSSGVFGKTEDSFSYDVSVGVTWLLHFVSVGFVSKDKNNTFKLKIFGINLMKSKKKTKSEKKKKKSDTVTVKEKVEVNKTEIKLPDTIEKEEKHKETVKEASKNTVKERKIVSEETKTDSDDNTNGKKTIKEKIVGVFNKISHICDKIKNVNEVKNSFIAYLKKEDSKVAIREIKHIILNVLKHILPQKLKAKVKFGFENPATTGNILGAASILYGIYGDKLVLEPDFENQVFEGEYSLNGRIRVFSLLAAAWKLYRNKWIRDFISFSKKSVQGL